MLEELRERNRRRNCFDQIDSCGICGKRVGCNTASHTVYEVDTWKMHENEKGNLQFCKTFCLLKMHKCWRWHGRTSGGIMR